MSDGDGYADANRITVINGAHSLIKHLIIKSASKIVYETDNPHTVTFVEYSDDYGKSVAKNSLWYLGTDNTTANTDTGFEARQTLTKAAPDDALNAGGKDVNVIIPLNWYSFFEELEDKMLVPMQLQFNIALNNDDEVIHKANAADNGRVVVSRFILCIPKLTPRQHL